TPNTSCHFHAPLTPTIPTLSLHDALPILAAAPHLARRGLTRHAEPLSELVCYPEHLGVQPAVIEGVFRALESHTDRFAVRPAERSEEHTSELQSRSDLVCRLLLEKKKKNK